MALAWAVGLSLMGFASGVQAAAHSWELRNGQWQATDDPPTTRPTTQPMTDETLDRAELLLAQGHAGQAKHLLVQWARNNKSHPLRDRAIFLLSQAEYELDDRIRSFYFCDELMEEYPESPLFYNALQRQYDIADAFLNGYKRVFLGLRILDTTDEATEMMYRIQQRSPGSPLAEKALLRTADYYYADSQYDLAADAYGTYVRSYPRSPKVPRARLRQAFSNYAQFRGLRFDATPLVDARAELLSIAAEYPDLAKEENLLPIVDRIDDTFARKIYVTADFYRRTSEPRAAVYNYRFLISAYPNSQEAQAAREWLKKMPVRALAEPAPTGANGYLPATLPSVTEAK
jgi:outer membrane assembly lipoprotein YfiO